MDAPTQDFPTESPPLPDDYSDVASAPSEEDAATERTKYQRGGRKQSTTNHIRASRMPPVPEAEAAAEPKHREEVPMDYEKAQVKGTACPECAARKQETAEKQPVEEKPPTPFETGIRAFNLKKAAASGGRPVGIRAETSESKKSKKKASKKEKKKTKKKQKAEPKESETEEESSSEEEDEEDERPRPMSIKLDLNLVVEIFLKAKIQGEVTITFLWVFPAWFGNMELLTPEIGSNLGFPICRILTFI
jgi:hypothetical protein